VKKLINISQFSVKNIDSSTTFFIGGVCI